MGLPPNGRHSRKELCPPEDQLRNFETPNPGYCSANSGPLCFRPVGLTDPDQVQVENGSWVGYEEEAGPIRKRPYPTLSRVTDLETHRSWGF